ncbi:manganese efflux pump MntP family protein [Kineococcus gynurae]|uniref:Putative manganese efflux pump MntP n=1 Tax=Kineococcus gynurae TaxID=452979 RepID=A0ABV5LP78_9ACTN
MSAWTLVLVALGVSADAFAVALGKGLGMTRLRLKDSVALALVFGLFQAVMPLLGWALARSFRNAITEVDHWVALGLLALIGLKMIKEAVGADPDRDDGHRLKKRELFVLGLATSIDALAVGISFAFLDVSIVPAVLLIGVTTALLSLAGVVIGHRAGLRWRRPAEIAGGVILIGIGVNILVEHLGLL